MKRLFVVTFVLAAFIISSCSTATHAGESKNGIDNAPMKISDMTKSINALEKKLNNIEKDIPAQISEINKKIVNLEDNKDMVMDYFKKTKKKISEEIKAAKYLSEISNFNLIFPKFVISILAIFVALFSIFLGIMGWWFRSQILKKLDFEIKNLKGITAIMALNYFRKNAWYYNNYAVNEFLIRKNIDSAIFLAEFSIKSLKKAKEIDQIKKEKRLGEVNILEFFELPSAEDIKLKDATYRSNLAFYCAKKKVKAERSIRWAKLGLEEGIRHDKIDLIDNYLYILMNFSGVIKEEDRLEGKRIYKIYEININKSKTIPDTQKVKFTNFWGETRKSMD